MWWHTPIVLATWEVEMRNSREPTRLTSVWSNRAKRCLEKKKDIKKKEVKKIKKKNKQQRVNNLAIYFI